MGATGWRLTLEPSADLVAWSLLRADDLPRDDVQVWSGLIHDASSLRNLAADATRGAAPLLMDPTTEARVAGELGAGLLPPALQRGLVAGSGEALLTICTRGWLAGVPWDALAVGEDGARLVQTCRLMGGLAPGLLPGDAAPNPPEPVSDHPAGLWLIDPGPPDGPWPPLYASGYPESVTKLIPLGARLLPDGLTFSPEDFAKVLQGGASSHLIYLGHIGSTSDSPAGVGLVLSGSGGAELLTAHAWLRQPNHWPAPERVALLGCGSDDSAPLEQTGLVTAALNAGASVVTGTRWPLPNDRGTIRILTAVSEAFGEQSVLSAMHRWQCSELETWRRSGDPHASPLYWSAPVTYDRTLLTAARRTAV